MSEGRLWPSESSPWHRSRQRPKTVLQQAPSLIHSVLARQQ
jgi:hypothetical protein